jgi:hypothetical protein
MTAIGGQRGLDMLTLSFVGPDPEPGIDGIEIPQCSGPLI